MDNEEKAKQLYEQKKYDEYLHHVEKRYHTTKTEEDEIVYKEAQKLVSDREDIKKFLLIDKKDFYKILNVNKNDSAETIKKAYHRLAIKYHPDRNKIEGSGEVFTRIQSAYKTLSDEAKRSAYDSGTYWNSSKTRRRDFYGSTGYETGSFYGSDFGGFQSYSTTGSFLGDVYLRELLRRQNTFYGGTRRRRSTTDVEQGDGLLKFVFFLILLFFYVFLV